MDLNLSKKDGCEVLKEIKENKELKTIPVIILITSSAETDILGVYDFHANAYLIKPLNFEEFITVIKSIEDFWFKAVTLPPKLASKNRMKAWKSCLYCRPKDSHFEYILEQVYFEIRPTSSKEFYDAILPHYAGFFSLF